MTKSTETSARLTSISLGLQPEVNSYGKDCEWKERPDASCDKNISRSSRRSVRRARPSPTRKDERYECERDGQVSIHDCGYCPDGVADAQMVVGEQSSYGVTGEDSLTTGQSNPFISVVPGRCRICADFVYMDEVRTLLRDISDEPWLQNVCFNCLRDFVKMYRFRELKKQTCYRRLKLVEALLKRPSPYDEEHDCTVEYVIKKLTIKDSECHCKLLSEKEVERGCRCSYLHALIDGPDDNREWTDFSRAHSAGNMQAWLNRVLKDWEDIDEPWSRNSCKTIRRFFRLNCIYISYVKKVDDTEKVLSYKGITEYDFTEYVASTFTHLVKNRAVKGLPLRRCESTMLAWNGNVRRCTRWAHHVYSDGIHWVCKVCERNRDRLDRKSEYYWYHEDKELLSPPVPVVHALLICTRIDELVDTLSKVVPNNWKDQLRRRLNETWCRKK